MPIGVVGNAPPPYQPGLVGDVVIICFWVIVLQPIEVLFGVLVAYNLATGCVSVVAT
jgi:hypothetical protein